MSSDTFVLAWLPFNHINNIDDTPTYLHFILQQMIVLILIIFILLVFAFLCKRIFIKQLQFEYEKTLLDGNKKRAMQLGKIYYSYLNKTTNKAKKVANIHKKIIEDFRSFNIVSMG